MKFMFIWPGIKLNGWESLKYGRNLEATYISHGLSMISAELKNAGHQCFLVDMRSFQHWGHFKSIIKQQQFDICCIGFHTIDREYAEEAIRLIKRYFPDKLLVAGGAHISTTGEVEFPGADINVVGEGEEIILEIIKDIENKSWKRVYQATPIQNLDSLPFLDRDLFNSSFEVSNPFLPALSAPFITCWASRGCPYNCSFCTKRSMIFGQAQRCRSVENFIEELKICWRSNSGIGSLMIHDDLMPPRKWLEEFIPKFKDAFDFIPFWCQMRADFVAKNPELIKELADVGLIWVSLGVEALTENMLKFLNKHTTPDMNYQAMEILHSNNVNVFCNLITGLPGQTNEDYQAIETFLKNTSPAFLSLSTYTAYPGSDIYDYCIKNNLFDDGYYSESHRPLSRKIKGVDYQWLFSKQAEWNRLRGKVKYPTRKSKVTIGFDMIQGDKPKVSCIITSYNRPDMLVRAVDSIFNQTFQNWEIIIIDDCSTGVEIEKVLGALKGKENIRIIRHDKNINNISWSWNEGLDIAQGEYICTLDDDNEKMPDFMVKMISFLDCNRDHDAVACFNHINDTIYNQKSIHEGPRQWDEGTLLKNNTTDSGELLIRRTTYDKIGYYDENMVTCEDWDFVIRLFYNCKVGLIQEPLAVYNRHHKNRMWKSNELGRLNHVEYLKKKKLKNPCRIMTIIPSRDRVTVSQEQVNQGYVEGLQELEYVKCEVRRIGDQINPSQQEYDFVFVINPLNIDEGQVKAIWGHGLPLIGIHLEDPPGLNNNVGKIGYYEWIVTNDMSTWKYYRHQWNGRNKGEHGKPKDWGKEGQVICCPALSIREKLLSQLKPKKWNEKQFDLMFCGYGYHSRKVFMKDFQEYHQERKILVQGDGWDGFQFTQNIIWQGTQDEVKTMQNYMNSRLIVCLHRENGDIGQHQIDFESVARGYVEAYSGSVVMIDSKRKQHSFNEEVVFFSGLNDLNSKIVFYLNNCEEAEKIGSQARQQAIEKFTFKRRMAEIVNTVRTPRYNRIIE